MIRLVVPLFALLAMISSVSAQDVEETPPQPSKEIVPVDAGPKRPPPALVLPAGGLKATLALTTDLSKGDVGTPVSLSPDLAVAVTDRLTVAAVHTSRGLFGFDAVPGTSLCFNGGDEGCPAVYEVGGLEARYLALAVPGFALAPEVGAYLLGTDPFQLGLNLAVVTRLETEGGWFLETGPQFTFALNEREVGLTELLNVPIDFGWQNPHSTVALQTGVSALVKEFSDAYRVPITLYGQHWLTPTIGVHAALSFATVLSGDAVPGNAFDNRAAQVSVLLRSE